MEFQQSKRSNAAVPVRSAPGFAGRPDTELPDMEGCCLSSSVQSPRRVHSWIK